MYLLVDSGIFSSLPRNANHNAGNGVQIVCDRGKDLSAFAATSICSRSSLQTRQYIRKWIEIHGEWDTTAIRAYTVTNKPRPLFKYAIILRDPLTAVL